MLWEYVPYTSWPQEGIKLAFLFCVTSEQFSRANYIIWYLIDSAERMLV